MDMGMDHGHGLRTWAWVSVALACVSHFDLGCPIPLSHFGCDESPVGYCAIFLAISHAHGDPLPKQQLVNASRDRTTETLAKLGGYRNHTSIYQNPRVPSFGLCHRRGRALLT
jgi:hypothetical protein